MLKTLFDIFETDEFDSFNRAEVMPMVPIMGIVVAHDARIKYAHSSKSYFQRTICP